MTYEKYESLILKLEKEAEKNPKTYLMKSLVLTLLGFAFIYFVLGTFIILFGITIYMIFFDQYHYGTYNLSKISLVLGIIIIAILRALWFKPEEPEGLEVNAQEFPSLLQEIEKLNKKLKGPKIHKVLLTADLNASIVQHPRLGVFGFHKNFLMVGLPLLQALSKNEVKAVLAHEIGHLTGSHGVFSNFVYRNRLSWERILEALEKEHRDLTMKIFDLFFKWYIPYLLAYTHILDRKQEYEADAVSAKALGNKNVAEMLLTLELTSRYYHEKFLNELNKEAEKSHTPPKDVYARLHQSIRSSENVLKDAWIKEAFMKERDLLSTHPSLKERVTYLGFEPNEIAVSLEEASYVKNSKELVKAIQFFNDRFVRVNSEAWREYYNETKESFQTLLSLSEKKKEEITEDDSITLIDLTERFYGEEKALELADALVTLYPESTSIQFRIGNFLIRNGDEKGVSYLEYVMEQDPASKRVISELLYNHFIEKQKEEEAEIYYKILVEEVEYYNKAYEERTEVSSLDTFTHHRLPPEKIKALVKQLSKFKEIKKGYICEKELNYDFGDQLIIVGITFKRPMSVMNMEKWEQEFLQNVANNIDISCNVQVFPLTIENRWLKKRLKEIPNSLVYTKTK